MLDVAARASDHAFAAAIFERWLVVWRRGRRSGGALRDARRTCAQRLGDEEAEARVVARAIHEGVVSPVDLDAHLERLAESVCHARRAALAHAGEGASDSAAGGDVDAACRPGASSAPRSGTSPTIATGRSRRGSRAARAADSHGYTTLALDLVAFSDPKFAFEWLVRTIEGEDR